MSSRHLQDMSSRHVFKTSSRYVFKTCLQDMSSRRLQDMSSRHVFKTSSRHVFKTSSKHVFKTSSTRLQRFFVFQDVFKTSRRLCKTSSRRLEAIVTLKTCLMKVLGPYPDGSLLYSNSFYQGYEFAKWLNTSMIAILKLEQNN